MVLLRWKYATALAASGLTGGPLTWAAAAYDGAATGRPRLCRYTAWGTVMVVARLSVVRTGTSSSPTPVVTSRDPLNPAKASCGPFPTRVNVRERLAPAPESKRITGPADAWATYKQ